MLLVEMWDGSSRSLQKMKENRSPDKLDDNMMIVHETVYSTVYVVNNELVLLVGSLSWA